MPYKDPAKRRACAAASARRARAANPERFRIIMRKSRAADPEKTRAISRQNKRDETARDPEGMRRKKRAYRLAHVEKIRAYARAHAIDACRYTHNYAARKKALPDTFTREQHVFMLQYWQFSCAICGREEGFEWTLAMDHFIPLSADTCPGTVAGNILPLCHGIEGCNNTKGKKDPHLWLVERFGPRKAKTIEKHIAAYFAVVAQRFGLEESA